MSALQHLRILLPQWLDRRNWLLPRTMGRNQNPGPPLRQEQCQLGGQVLPLPLGFCADTLVSNAAAQAAQSFTQSTSLQDRVLPAAAPGAVGKAHARLSHLLRLGTVGLKQQGWSIVQFAKYLTVKEGRISLHQHQSSSSKCAAARGDIRKYNKPLAANGLGTQETAPLAQGGPVTVLPPRPRGAVDQWAPAAATTAKAVALLLLATVAVL